MTSKMHPIEEHLPAAIRDMLRDMHACGFMTMLPMLHGTATNEGEVEFARMVRRRPAYWEIACSSSHADVWHSMVSYLSLSPTNGVVDVFRIIVQSDPHSMVGLPRSNINKFWTKLYEHQLSKITQGE